MSAVDVQLHGSIIYAGTNCPVKVFSSVQYLSSMKPLFTIRDHVKERSLGSQLSDAETSS